MDRAYEDATVLSLGVRGELDGAPFELTGRTCIRGRRGTIWNEWTLRFDDGRTAFLAESSGAFTVYEEHPLVPTFCSMLPGAPVDTGFVVVERGQAARVAHWGAAEEAPASYFYADLSSREGRPATIDFGSLEPRSSIHPGTREPPRVFVGRKMTLAELRLRRSADGPTFIAAPQVSRPKGVEQWLEVGDEGELEGRRVRVVGMLSRSTGADRSVAWDEYLLYDADRGVQWLVVTGGHWSLVEHLEAGLVRETASEVRLGEDVYPMLSEGTARVDWATGELPWQVAIGDESCVKDFVHAPWLITKEWSDDEVTWSRGKCIAPDVIAKAFDKRVLPRPTT